MTLIIICYFYLSSDFRWNLLLVFFHVFEYFMLLLKQVHQIRQKFIRLWRQRIWLRKVSLFRVERRWKQWSFYYCWRTHFDCITYGGFVRVSLSDHRFQDRWRSIFENLNFRTWVLIGRGSTRGVTLASSSQFFERGVVIVNHWGGGTWNRKWLRRRIA